VAERVVRVVWVSANHGIGIALTEQADFEVRYNGQVVSVKPVR